MNNNNNLHNIQIAQLSAEQQKTMVNSALIKKTSKRDPALHAAQQFEQVFLTQYLSLMTNEVGLPLIEEEGAGTIYKAWQNEAYAEILSKSGTTGIAQQILRSTIIAKYEANNG